MKKLLLIVLTITSISSYAMVPITTSLDPNALSAAATVSANAGTYLNQIQQAQSVATQIQGLHGLQQLQTAGSGLCNLCNPTDQAQLQSYLNNINGDLCTQFSNAMSNLGSAQQSFTSLQGIIGALSATNPQAASLNLAQSSATTLTSVSNTLAQMQAMQAQNTQKQLAQEKYDTGEATQMSQMNLGH